MSRLRAALAASVVLPMLLLASCGGAGEPGAGDRGSGAMFQSDVDVDTPQLRAAKTAAGIEDCVPGSGEPVTGGLPKVTLPCLGGGPDVDLSALRGPLVVNLWAQWCGPCREEMPYYQRLHEEAGDRLSVVGVDYQDTLPLQALQLAEQTGVTFPLLADPAGRLKVPFRVRGLPGVALVDRDGTVVELQYTVIRSYDQLRELVAEHLDVRV